MDISRSRVVITGGAGFIGSHLADQLLSLGCTVTVLDNLDDFYSGKEQNYSHNLSNPRYRLVNGDILDAATLKDVLKGAGVVFHQAAQAGVRFCIENPMRAHEVNVRGTLNVLLAAKEAEVKKLVFASSSSVYGVPKRVPLTEEMMTEPTSIYGATKLAGEKYCRALSETGGVPTTSLRYFSVYGPRGRPDQVIHAFADKIKHRTPPVIYGDGKQTRDFTYVSDVVTAAIFAAENEECDGEVLNIGFGKEVTIADLAEKIIIRMGSSLKPEYRRAYAGDFPRTLCGNEKARRLLRWRPVVGLDEGLTRFLEWYDSAGRKAAAEEAS